MMRIMSDPEQRRTMMGVMEEQRVRDRISGLGLSDYQTEEVLRIEKESREKRTQALTSARERGASPEEVKAELDQIDEETDLLLEGVLTPEQKEGYDEAAENEGSGFPGFGPPPSSGD